MATLNATIAGSMPSNDHEPDDVHIALRLNMKERLMALTYTSSIDLVATRDHQFTSSHFDSLRRFNGFLRNDYTNLFPRITRPVLELFLVLLRPNAATRFPGRPEVRICMGGLRSHQEIVHFHQVLTQPHLRVHSDPLKLCFNRALVEMTGSDTLHTVSIETGSDTLCGGLLQSRTAGDHARKSTIGGIIDINDVSCAVTIVHNSKKYSRDSKGASVNNAMFFSEETLIEPEHHAYLEPPLVVDGWESDNKTDEWRTTVPDVESLTTSINGTMETAWPPRDEEIIFLDEWALIPVPARLKRPNIHAMPGSSGVQPRYIMNTRQADSPTKLRVSIIPGVSQMKVGMMSHNISFLMQDDGTSYEVWTVSLTSNQSLQRGDSGSWVVDLSNGSLVGSVTATSPGVAHIIPISDLVKKIHDHFKQSLPAKISMPAPFFTYLNQLKHQQMGMMEVDQYLEYAVSERSLQLSAEDKVAGYFLKSVKDGGVDDVKKLVKEMRFDHQALERLFDDVTRQTPTGISNSNKKLFALAQSIIEKRANQDLTEGKALGKRSNTLTPTDATTSASIGQRIRGKVSRMLSRGPNSKERTSKSKPKDIQGDTADIVSSHFSPSNPSAQYNPPPVQQFPYTPPSQAQDPYQGPGYPQPVYPQSVYAQAAAPSYAMPLPTPPQVQYSHAGPYYPYPLPAQGTPYEMSTPMQMPMPGDEFKITSPAQQPFVSPYGETPQTTPVYRELEDSPRPVPDGSLPPGAQPSKGDQQN